MSTPKKPGTDLAALKARLAKKSKGAGAAPAGGPLPPPGSVAPPADVPPPGSVAPVAVPPPGQVAAPPAPEPTPQPMHHPGMSGPGGDPAPAMGPAPTGDDPFGGGMGSFDPSEGVLDVGGDVAPRSNKGLIVFAMALGVGVGIAAGFLGNKIISTRERVDIGKEKGAEMLQEVQNVAEVRKTVSLAMEDLKKKMATDPKAAAADISAMLSDNFDKHPKVDALFGWQLAAVHSAGIKKTFDLYEEANRLRLDLGYLSAFLDANADALKAAGGPTLFAVVFKTDGATMVEALQPMCGEVPEGGDLSALKPCGDGGSKDAKGYEIRDAIGGQPKVVARGTAPGQAMLLLPEGQIYTYAIGEEPSKNALAVRNGMVQRIQERLDSMAKAEKVAERALENYASDPDVDGSSPQPDPGDGGEG